MQGFLQIDWIMFSQMAGVGKIGDSFCFSKQNVKLNLLKDNPLLTLV
jgi:hypothetical protein